MTQLRLRSHDSHVNNKKRQQNSQIFYLLRAVLIFVDWRWLAGSIDHKTYEPATRMPSSIAPISLLPLKYTLPNRPSIQAVKINNKRGAEKQTANAAKVYQNKNKKNSNKQ